MHRAANKGPAAMCSSITTNRKNTKMAESAWRLFIFFAVLLVFYIQEYEILLSTLLTLSLIGLAEVVWAALSLLYHIGLWAFF
jgi:hypothetical protein